VRFPALAGRGTQVVRERSAKPLCVGSIPTRASKFLEIFQSKKGLPLQASMDWGIYQHRVRFDVGAERSEYERLFAHRARVLQDRLARRGHTDRTRKHAITDWERNLLAEMRERRLLNQARVLSWGKEKSYYFAQKNSA
jgi:hypothetical protein